MKKLIVTIFVTILMMGCSAAEEKTYSYSSEDTIEYQKEQEKKMDSNWTEDLAGLLIPVGLFIQFVNLI